MNTLKHSIFAFVLTSSSLGVCSPASAGVWDDPKNLKALSEDISPGELRSTMMGMARGTGSRCSTCHVGEVETDLRTYDFSLDDKEEKRKARTMILMVRDINNYLTENLGEHTAEQIKVECATCHRGRARPEMIEDVLTRIYRDEGLEEALTEYRELRETYYGGYAFDFSARSLNRLAEAMAADSQIDAALGFLQMNMEFNPRSVRTFQLQGDVWKEKGDVAAAKDNYQKALDIDPDNRWTRHLLDTVDTPRREN